MVARPLLAGRPHLRRRDTGLACALWDDRRLVRLKLFLAAVLYACAAVVGRGG